MPDPSPSPCRVWGWVGGCGVGLRVPREVGAETAMGKEGLLRPLGGNGPAAYLMKSQSHRYVQAVPLLRLIVTWPPGPEPSLATDPVWLSPPLAS